MVRNPADHHSEENHHAIINLMKSAADFVVYQLAYDESNPHLFKVNFVSPSITDILGILEPMRFDGWFENIHPDDRKIVENIQINAFKTGRFNAIFRIYHPKKKEIRWVHAMSTSTGSFPLRKGKRLHVMGLVIDVTNQKKAEAALLESNERFKSITETIPDLIFELDLEGRIKFCTSVIEKLLGYSFEEISEKKFQELISPNTLQVAIEGFEALITGNHIRNMRVDILRKDAEYLPCEISAGPLIISGKAVAIQGIVRDILTQKKAEKEIAESREHLKHEVVKQTRELMESEARYRGIVEGSRDLVCRLVPDGTITFTNQIWNKYFESEKEGLCGRNFFECVAEGDDVKAVERNMKSSFLNAFPSFVDRKVTLPNGSICWIRWTGHRLFTNDVSFSEYQVTGQDITKQKNDEIEKSKIELFQRRAQKLEALGTLSAGIAHDFNNILAVLLGNVQLATDDVPEGSRTRKNIDEMTKAILRARDMVKQILTFCRKGEQTLRPLSLTPFVKESAKFLRSTIPSTIELHENIQETGLVRADPTQISQVMINLGSNAAHAMGRETGILEISLETVTIDDHHEIRFRVPDEGRYVKLDVRDTGSGMTSEVISRVFDPYFTTKGEGEGSGMGLAVVHGIIEAHGGIIWANSTPGKGSVFSILFPVVNSDAIPEIQINVPVLGGAERILLVDDRENLLYVEKDLLEHLGYKVTAKTDPIDALEAFREHPHRFDLIYTDMTMPHMNGLTLSKMLIEIRPDIPIILYTGLGDLVDSDEIEKCGIRAFLKKPILLEDLASTIRKVLEHDKNQQS